MSPQSSEHAAVSISRIVPGESFPGLSQPDPSQSGRQGLAETLLAGHDRGRFLDLGVAPFAPSFAYE
jgi:hypothetical protein